MASPENPRISICVPVYNGEAFLSQALDSILAQTYRDYELLISDNASTDSTAEICRHYAARDPRIQYSRNAVNIGANPNFNRLIQLARAPYFKLANADDLCAPELLARCVTVLDRHPEVVLCYARTRLIDATGRVLRDYDDNLDLRLPSAVARFMAVNERLGLVNVLHGVIRTDVLRKTSCLGSYAGADTLLVMELALRGQFNEVPDRLFFRRMHDTAASSLKRLDEQQMFVNPQVRPAHTMRIWRQHRGYVSAIARTPLSLLERLALCGWVIRSFVWHRKSLGRELANLVRFSLGRVLSREKAA